MTSNIKFTISLFILLFIDYVICEDILEQTTYPNWKLHYPEGSYMGLFLAVAIPLTLTRNSAYLAFNWEANYLLPGNQTEFTYPPIIGDRISRKLIYEALETKLRTQGYPGRNCLLRLICEASENALSEVNGVLGDILDIILKPSTSKNPDLSNKYLKAEKHGMKYKNCDIYNEKCSVSFLDLVTCLEVSN